MTGFITWWIKFTLGILVFFYVGVTMNVPGALFIVPIGWILISIFGAYNFYNRKKQDHSEEV